MDLTIGILFYNHEKFVDAVLTGIINQKTKYKYEILINDDASTDTTISKVENFIKRKSLNNITIFKNKKNKGQLNAVKNIYSNSRGKYLIIQDGDDYWVFDKKIETQLSFLEENNTFIASCHDAKIRVDYEFYSKSLFPQQSKKGYKYISQFTQYGYNEINNWDLLTGKAYIQNCTLVFKKFELSPYFHLFKSVKFNLDWLFSIVLSIEGRINYINEPWSVYVDHGGGRTKNNMLYNYFKDKIVSLKQLSKIEYYNNFEKKKEIFSLIALQYNSLIENESGGNKSKKEFYVWMIKYVYYSILSALAFFQYFWKKRKILLKK